MFPVRIRVLRRACYTDLMERYERKMEEPCQMREGQTFCCYEAMMPAGFCQSAWLSLYPYVLALASGAASIHGEWMKDPYSALVSCNDGFRPVSFLLETIRSQEQTCTQDDRSSKR